MTRRILDYKIAVVGLEIDEHPVARITKSLRDASEIMDLFRSRYPNHTIVMSQSVEEEIAKFTPLQTEKPPEPGCPRGHSGSANGKSVIVRNDYGNYCAVCGEFFTSPEQ